MKSKNKLEEFVKDLNLMIQDTTLFSKPRSGRFDLKTKEWDKKLTINLNFVENGFNHPIYMKTVEKLELADEEIYREAYSVILKMSYFVSDYVGMAKDKNENVVNFLSFKTLISKGLDKLKK